MDGTIASMSKEIILITGGARSGKSEYAEHRAVELRRSLNVANGDRDVRQTVRLESH